MQSNRLLPEGFGEEFIKPLTVITSERGSVSSLQPPLFTKLIPSRFPPNTPLTCLLPFPSNPLFHTLEIYPYQLFLTFGK